MTYKGYNVYGAQSIIYHDVNASSISIIIINQQYGSSTVFIAAMNQNRNVIIPFSFHIFQR